MTELERLLSEQLQRLSEAHERQFKLLSEQQEQQAKALEALSKRVAVLTGLLEN